jgi:hypothetical protein
VPQLLAAAPGGRYVLRIAETPNEARPLIERVVAGIGSLGAVSPAADEQHVTLTLPPGGDLGPAIGALEASGVRVVSIAEEGSGIEDAFRFLTRDTPTGTGT